MTARGITIPTPGPHDKTPHDVTTTAPGPHEKTPRDVTISTPGPYGKAERALREAAAELAETAERIAAIGDRATAILLGPDLTTSAPRSPRTAWRAHRALLHALPHPHGLGHALSPVLSPLRDSKPNDRTSVPGELLGGRGGWGSLLGGVISWLRPPAGRASLAGRVAVTSLRLRVSALTLIHPELAGADALLDAVATGRDPESSGFPFPCGGGAMPPSVAMVAREVAATRALLTGHPPGRSGGGSRRPSLAGPPRGALVRTVTGRDGGGVAAERVPFAAASGEGGLLDYLGNIERLGDDGRVLLQEVRAGGTVGYVLQATDTRDRPGGAAHGSVGLPGSPEDLGGAAPDSASPPAAAHGHGNARLSAAAHRHGSARPSAAAYAQGLAEAVADFGVPDGALIALIGHGEGGAAVLGLARDAEFCSRYRVTHVVCVGAPVGGTPCADPRTWVASVSNRHDLVPALDVLAAGARLGPPPGWYTVGYTDPAHTFPGCHHVSAYLAGLRDDLPVTRLLLERRLAAYRGPVTRSQAYQLGNRLRPPAGSRFPSVATGRAGTSAGPVEQPLRQAAARAAVSLFAAVAAITIR
ncbi:hypothetical protein ABT294_46585 [Nonomuraea sp. NPDC000554]|uniref:hypothetical protein n=1 Tax=Nonomuraea sp. NPDC000554 TaxID=3154259 RepID=UPI00332735E2